ncbi:MAG: amidohydrolase family protein [Acidobacteria bacterium]|nr:amidohydrolase family protein [Acidobacteriota bacterium]
MIRDKKFTNAGMRRRANKTKSAAFIAVAMMLCGLLLTALSVKAQTSATAQSGVLAPQGTFLIRNARIVTVSGPEIENGSLLIRNGKIEAVGTNVTAPAGAEEINAQGLSIYPGMIDLGTSIGLLEIGSGAPGTVDTTEVGDMNPNASAIVAVNPHSAYVNVTRVNGVTSVVTMPLGGVISGQAAFINLNGTSQREMAVVEQAALVINFPRVTTTTFDALFNPQQGNITEAITTRDRQLEQLRKVLKDAEAYGRAQDAYARDKNLPRADQNLMLASLVPYVRGTRPVIFRANRESEIRGAVRFAEEMRLKFIIMGGNEAWKMTDFLREHNVAVVLTNALDLPSREDDAYDVNYASAAKLQQAGVRFCISTGSTGQFVRNLPLYAGMSAAFDLPRAEALKAITLYPAQIMNLADRMGSIEAGKMANLVITDGDLLDARTHVRYLFIEGRRLPLTSRHTELYEQFRNRK